MLNTNTKTTKIEKSYKKVNKNSLDFYVAEETASYNNCKKPFTVYYDNPELSASKRQLH